MKEMRNPFRLHVLLAAFVTAGATAGWGQGLYEDFNYSVPGNVGGVLTNTTGGSSNNWTTHSNTGGNSNSINLVSGSLNFTGLQNSTGNRINIPGNNTLVPRDINRATTISGGPSLAYYSFLLNVANTNQLAATLGDNGYFLAFGNTAASNTSTFFGRVSIRSVNSGSNFRLGIGNTTGGTPTYSEVPTDLSFGQTHLIVVKYDINGTNNDVATIWVNPSSLGGTEPAGGTSNNSGTASSVTTFASIAIRNSSATPNADIDEIRAGTTWASVTPASVLAPTVTSSSASSISTTGATLNGNATADG
ncbi:MAG: hypothetical protein EB023_14930, partial [Flavobacteriia bacterium]|nr:hypothetical protein [Flavobacteriia bacterium]